MTQITTKSLPFPCPQAPDWQIDWGALHAEYDWIQPMRDCVQDPVFHGEGDVWTHVQMVCEALVNSAEWRRLPSEGREVLFAAALLHDQAKPTCTREESGRVTSRGHSIRGAIEARRILWNLGADFVPREHVCALVRYHQSPLFLINRANPQRLAFLISQTARCDLLGMLAKADVLGRQCQDQQQLLERVALFEEYCREQECFTRARQFPSPHSRFEYFRTENRDPTYLSHEEFRCDVTIMSGLPGAGKDEWINRWLPRQPVVSLDCIRKELGTAATGNQGSVVRLAREQARQFLRQRCSFVWNGTNLSRAMRAQLVELFAAYHARVRIVYVEAAIDSLYRQNAERGDAVPFGAIAKLMNRWEVPAPMEADMVECRVDGKRVTGERA